MLVPCDLCWVCLAPSVMIQLCNWLNLCWLECILVSPLWLHHLGCIVFPNKVNVLVPTSGMGYIGRFRPESFQFRYQEIVSGHSGHSYRVLSGMFSLVVRAEPLLAGHCTPFFPPGFTSQTELPSLNKH